MNKGLLGLRPPTVTRDWLTYRPRIIAATDPVIGTVGHYLKGFFQEEEGGIVDYFITAKVGSSGYSAGSGTWNVTLPYVASSTPISPPFAVVPGAYLTGMCVVNDVSNSLGLGWNAHRIGVSGAPPASPQPTNQIATAFDAIPNWNANTTTVASGTTSTNVTHSLGIAPNRVSVSPTSSQLTSGMVDWYADTYGSTTFALHATKAAGAALDADQTFDWFAWSEASSYLSGVWPYVLASGDTIRWWGSFRRAD